LPLWREERWWLKERMLSPLRALEIRFMASGRSTIAQTTARPSRTSVETLMGGGRSLSTVQFGPGPGHYA